MKNSIKENFISVIVALIISLGLFISWLITFGIIDFIISVLNIPFSRFGIILTSFIVWFCIILITSALMEAASGDYTIEEDK